MRHSNLTNLFALPPAQTSRRSFLKLSSGASAGLVLGLAAPVRGLGGAAVAENAAIANASFQPNPFLIVAPDNTVTVIIKHLDKGQGAATGLATLVAEELDADWAQIKTEFAPSDAVKYKNSAFGVQGVGGSTGLSNSYEQYRQAGATAKAMLVAAAERLWGDASGKLTVRAGVVTHPSGKSATFGELAALAAAESVPGKVALKDPKDFIYIGKKFARVDSKDKSTGAAKFTIDHQFEGMLIAVIARPPQFGAVVKSFNAS